MKHIEGFNYNFMTEGKMDRQILYANAIFGIDQFFSEERFNLCIE